MKRNPWTTVYLIIYGIIFAYEFINTTMIDLPHPNHSGLIPYAIVGSYAAAKLIFQRKTYTRKEMIMSLAILVLFTLPAALTKYHFLFEIACLIVGAKGVEFRKIIKWYLIIGAALLVAVAVLAKTGVIADLAINDVNRGIRQSFGCVYPTDFAAHVFYLTTAWCVWSASACHQRSASACHQGSTGRQDSTGACHQRSAWHQGSTVVVPLVMAAFVYKASDAKTSTACLLLLAVGMLVCLISRRAGVTKDGKFWRVITTALPIGLSALFFILMRMYEKGTALGIKADNKLSFRLQYTLEVFRTYGIRLFGQSIEEAGYGEGVMPDHYMYVDSSYARVLLLYGAVTFVLLMAILIYIGWRCTGNIKKDAGTRNNLNRVLVVVLIVVEIHSFMEQHMVETAYDPYLLLVFATLLAPRQPAESKLSQDPPMA